jgi:hypothetical protein
MNLLLVGIVAAVVLVAVIRASRPRPGGLGTGGDADESRYQSLFLDDLSNHSHGGSCENGSGDGGNDDSP